MIYPAPTRRYFEFLRGIGIAAFGFAGVVYAALLLAFFGNVVWANWGPHPETWRDVLADRWALDCAGKIVDVKIGFPSEFILAVEMSDGGRKDVPLAYLNALPPRLPDSVDWRAYALTVARSRFVGESAAVYIRPNRYASSFPAIAVVSAEESVNGFLLEYGLGYLNQPVARDRAFTRLKRLQHQAQSNHRGVFNTLTPQQFYAFAPKL